MVCQLEISSNTLPIRPQQKTPLSKDTVLLWTIFKLSVLEDLGGSMDKNTH